MARNPENRRLREEYYASGFVSCADCGVLCWQRPGTVKADRLYDVPAKLDWLLEQTVGLRAVMAQGVGVGNGGLHLCPPTHNLNVVVIGGVPCLQV